MSNSADSINQGPVPRHIAIIMDGNGRWAKSKGLPRSAGHRAGAETVRKVVEEAIELGVEHLTVYAFSSENWKRPAAEVKSLMNLLERFLKQKTKEMNKRDVRLAAIGRTLLLPQSCQDALNQAIATTKDNKSLTLTLALSYGSREEIVDATKAIAQKVADGELCPEEISNSTISNHLYTQDTPDPDLLIRTSGELRISNFLLWQISYAELYISDKNWPEFSPDDLREAVRSYQQRHRRFGLV